MRIVPRAAGYPPGSYAPSLVSAFSLFGTPLATSTATAESSDWTTTLGATVTVRDAGGTARPAQIYYAPKQINYRLPENAATGYATVTIAAGGANITGNINIRDSYPNLSIADETGLAVGYVTRVRNGQQSVEPVAQSIDLGASSDHVYLVVYGSGRGSADSATATIGGMGAEVTFAGAQGTYPGMDQYNILVPRALAGKGKVDIVIAAGGRQSNRVNVSIQ